MEPEVMVRGGVAASPAASALEALIPESSQPQAALARLIEQLIMLAAFLKELETQSHLIHLNFEGPMFLEVHKFLKEQYEAHVEQFDQVAELVRSMDYWMPLCACGLKDAVCGFRHVDSHDGRAMLITYYGNLEAMGYLAKAIEPMAQEVGAPDAANLMAELVNAAFKGSWFIKSLLRGC